MTLEVSCAGWMILHFQTQTEKYVLVSVTCICLLPVVAKLKED